MARFWPFRKSEKRAISANDPISADHWIVRVADGIEQAGYNLTGDGALRQATVFACVRVLAESIASLPLHIYEELAEGSKKQARQHYLWPLLHDSPNNFQTSYEFWEMVVGHMCLRGNAYSFLERNGRGQISRIVPIHPDRIKPQIKNPEKQILEYEYTAQDGSTVKFPAEQIWHQKGLSQDGYCGLSVIEMGKRAITLSKVAEDHGTAYFRNGARASGIAKLPGMLKGPAKDRLKDSINEAMTGDNKFRVLVFEQGMEWQQLSLTNEDSQYLETRNFQVQEIARLFRVPTILIGHPDKTSTYASAEQFMLSFVTHTLRPWLVRNEQSIKKNLMTKDERLRYFAKFKIDALLRGDTKTRYEAYLKARQARWMSANEIRALEDMNPIEGGDDYENPMIDTKQTGGQDNAVTGGDGTTDGSD